MFLVNPEGLLMCFATILPGSKCFFVFCKAIFGRIGHRWLACRRDKATGFAKV